MDVGPTITELSIPVASTLVWSSGWRSRPAPLGADIFPFGMPEGVTASALEFAPETVPSPDGKSIAFVADSRGTRYLWVRQLASETPQRLDHTEGADLFRSGRQTVRRRANLTDDARG
jgi:hypothetical protein